MFNTLLADKATDDRLRSYPHWLAARNLDNEASDESVAALVAAVRARYELARRWYRLKARLLGIERLADYDRMAPLAADEERVDWPQARELVLDSYGAFSPTLGASPSASSTSAGSMRRPAAASTAARSAPTRCRPCTPTCCSTTPAAGATC